MCGFAGRYQPGGEPTLPADARPLTHRGPNDAGHYTHPDLVLSHFRLSIRDTTAAGHQPMVGSGGQVLAYNGEIYNAQALSIQLKKEGIALKSTSDTEVVLEWLSLKGSAGLADLNGCFAIAFWNPDSRVLLLSRDVMGIKPLYVSEKDGTLTFGSEVRAMGAFQADWDAAGLASYLSTGFTPEGKSLQTGIRSLYPGEVLEWSPSEEKSSVYVPKIGRTSTLRETLTAAITERMVSDVPLGAFLSGGLDSSIIAAVASQHTPNLNTFSLGFELGGVLDERADAARVAQHLGTTHHEKVLTEEEVLAELDHWFQAMDLPFGDASALAVYHLSKFAKQHVTVALSGDGADEVFAGYRRHRAFQQSLALTPTQRKLATHRGLQKRLAGFSQSREGKLGLRIYGLCKFMGLASLPLDQRYAYLTRFVQPETLAKVFVHTPYALASAGSLQEALLADQAGILPSDMLTKVDRMSMAHGLEVRVPFMDSRVVDLGRNLPLEQLVHKGIGKRALRDAFAQDLPASTLSKSKHGFEIPMERWLKGPLWSNVLDVLNPNAFPQEAGWKVDGIQELLGGYQHKSTPESTHLLWNLWVLKRWELAHSLK